MNFRRFPAEVEKVAAQWYENPISVASDKWFPTGHRPAGESNPFWVSNGDGRLGIAKPGICSSTDAHLYAAREKIASDLGFILGLPVPPVLLKKFELPEYRIGWAAISISPFRNPVTLRQFQSPFDDDLHMPTEEKEHFNVVANAALVFDTLIDNSDHNPGNILLNDRRDDSEDFGTAMIDYAWSMRSWNRVNVELNFNRKFYGTEKVNSLLVEVAARYHALQPERIREIVQRLPNDVLDAANKSLFEQNLLHRQNGLIELVRAQTDER